MRLILLKYIFLGFLVVILIRLFYWQVIRFDDLSALAEKQHKVSLKTEGRRGLIFSSDGSILAINKPSFLLFANPKIVEDKEEASLQLAETIFSFMKDKDQTATLKNEQFISSELLNLKNKIYLQLSQNLFWVSLQKDLSLEEKKQLEKLNLKGVGFEEETTRFYPEASSSAHVLGFVGSDDLGRKVGYFGVEGFYNGDLKGVSGIVTQEKDALGLPILIGNFFQKESQEGHSLILHLDRTVQYIIEKKLKEGVEKYGAKSASVVVMEPKSGAILGMASLPNYDPNEYTKFSKEFFRNSVVADSYEPGSTFKVLVMAAALNEGVIKTDTRCTICDGPIKIGGYTIRTWNNKYQKDATMTDVIVHSDNTGMVFVGQKLGVDNFYRYLTDFGFGKLTGIDLQDEAFSPLRVRNTWKEIDLATASFGQGIAVTPIQVVKAVAALANGGELMEPHLVKEIRSLDKLIVIKPKVVGKPVSKETAFEITRMMVKAVEEGEARAFAPKGYKIAGKTGTAQIPVAGHYDPKKTIASFVGFAPADDPKFVVLVRYTEPSSSIFGSETAAPTFFEIIKELFLYYKIPPSE